MTLNRRSLLRMMGATALATTATSWRPVSFTSHAAETSGYKALVCVFLYGGLDTHDVLLPYDTASYDDFAQIRSMLMAQQSSTRSRNVLLPLNPLSSSVLAGRQMALPPEMSNMKSLFDQQEMAVVGNVGPLIEPVTRSSFLAKSVRLPPRLFSHNDQQAVWQSSQPEGAQFGWGGLFADAMINAGANAGAEAYSTITTDEVGPLLTGNIVAPYRISTTGSAQIDLLSEINEGADQERVDLLNEVRRQLAASDYNGNHILERDMANAFGSALDINDGYNEALAANTPIATTFPNGPLGAQLKSVAEAISARDRLMANRQIFFVAYGGFDTHDGQASKLPAKLAEIDQSVFAFHQSMKELGLSQNVTLFTASDFGRTLAENGNGTDHGWGSHHFVVGGAVKGGDIYGSVPPAAFGHDADSGSGRLIPSVAVEQYAAELGRWFGLSPEELSSALPNLGNFNPIETSFI